MSLLILADTSIWIDHFRTLNKQMIMSLNEGLVVTHPFVLSELALGSLANRTALLQTLDELVLVDVARDFEVRQLIEARELYSKGIGLVDAHLLASMLFNSSLRLWTRDRRLAKVATEIDVPLHSDRLPN